MVFGRAVKDVFVVAAKRTPFGAFGGKFLKFSAVELQEVAGRAALEAGSINPEIIDTVNIGNIYKTTTNGGFLARHVGIGLGIPVSSPAVLFGNNCGSGFQAIISSCQELTCGDAQVSLAGGIEHPSIVPHLLHGVRFGTKLGQDLTIDDYLWKGVVDVQHKTLMGLTAENLAEKYGISRDDADTYAVQSHQRWKKAFDAGIFEAEMAPATITTMKGEEIMNCDEHPRPDTTKEIVAKLPTVFKKDGTVTAANSSGVCDGAGCVIVATEEACKTHDLKPLARIAGYGAAGCDPHIMGIGPVPAIQAILKATGQSLQDIDLVEVNEAFASQYLAVEKELGLDPAKTNVNGGAIAVGHPAAATGCRITAHLAHALRRTGSKYAMGAACIGGGQGIAILLENVD